MMIHKSHDLWFSKCSVHLNHVMSYWQFNDIRFFDLAIYKQQQGAISFEIFVEQLLLLHHKAEVPLCHNIAKNAIQFEICVAIVPICGTFCYAIQANSYPAPEPHLFPGLLPRHPSTKSYSQGWTKCFVVPRKGVEIFRDKGGVEDFWKMTRFGASFDSYLTHYATNKKIPESQILPGKELLVFPSFSSPCYSNTYS